MNEFANILQFHTDISHQVHKRSVLSQDCTKFPIIVPYSNKLIPFQIVISASPTITYFRLVCADDSTNYISLDTSLLNTFADLEGSGVFSVLYYTGKVAFTDTFTNGYYYLEISLNDGEDKIFYSNIFKIKT